MTVKNVETKQPVGTSFEAMSIFQLARVIRGAQASSAGKQMQVAAMARLDQIAFQNKTHPTFDPKCKWST